MQKLKVADSRQEYGEKNITKLNHRYRNRQEYREKNITKVNHRYGSRIPTSFRITFSQGWEFAYWFSVQISRFLRKNERMSDSLKKTSDLHIHSFLVSNLSNWLMVTHFW